MKQAIDSKKTPVVPAVSIVPDVSQSAVEQSLPNQGTGVAAAVQVNDKVADIKRREQEELDNLFSKTQASTDKQLNTPVQKLSKEEVSKNIETAKQQNKDLVEELENPEFLNDEKRNDEWDKKADELSYKLPQGVSFRITDGKVDFFDNQSYRESNFGGNTITRVTVFNLHKQTEKFEVGDRLQVDDGSRALPAIVTKVNEHGKILEAKKEDGRIIISRGNIITLAPINDRLKINAKYDAELAALKPAIPDVELPAITHSEQPMILVNEAMWTNEGIADQYWTPSAKTTNTVKANSADLKYITIAIGNRLMLRNETVYENGVWAPQLDDTSNKDRMVAGRIKAGDAVILRVDKDWDGKINNHHTLEQDEYLRGEKVPDTFAGYTDNGKIRTSESMKHQGYANVPIQIIHEATGKVIGYFPMNDWVNETLGAETYRNVEDYDEEGNPGMVDRQSRINLAIRKRIAEQWNADPTTEMKTTVAYRTTGRVMHAGEVSATGKVKYQVNTAFKMLPDPKLNMGVATKEAFLVGKGAAASNQMTLVQLKPAEREAMAGSPVVYLPMPNGEYLPQPLETKKLSGKSDFTTMSKVIELHLQAGTSHLTAEGEKMIADIQAATTFDISTTQGLKDFIEQYYTYTSNFMDAVTNVDAPADTDAEGKQSKVQQFLIAVPNSSTKLVKIGFTFSGRMPAYAKLQNGKLSDDFNNVLKAGLATRFKNVVFTDGNLRGTNDTRPITSVLITEDGQLRRYKHDNYNAYMKTFTYTSVYGHTKIDGNYVYAANSQTVLTPDPLLPQVPSVTSLTTRGTPDTETQMDVSDDESVIDSLSNFALAPGYVEPVIKPEGKPLTLENLTDLYNFTEAGERNGKTPEQVMTHLKSLNISALADGYNPFVKCS